MLHIHDPADEYLGDIPRSLSLYPVFDTGFGLGHDLSGGSRSVLENGRFHYYHDT